MSFVAGAVALRPADTSGWLRTLAAQLAAIHRHPADGFPWRFRSWVNRAALVTPAWSAVPRACGARHRILAEDRTRKPCRLHPSRLSPDQRPVAWRRRERRRGLDQRVPRAGGRRRGALPHQPGGNVWPRRGRRVSDRLSRDAADGFTYEPYWDVDSLLDMCLAGPSYYPPWQEFGLGAIPPQVLRQRADAYLESVMKRIA